MIIHAVLLRPTHGCVLPASRSRGYSRSLTGLRSESSGDGWRETANAAPTGQWFARGSPEVNPLSHLAQPGKPPLPETSRRKTALGRAGGDPPSRRGGTIGRSTRAMETPPSSVSTLCLLHCLGRPSKSAREPAEPTGAISMRQACDAPQRLIAPTDGRVEAQGRSRVGPGSVQGRSRVGKEKQIYPPDF